MNVARKPGADEPAAVVRDVSDRWPSADAAVQIGSEVVVTDGAGASDARSGTFGDLVDELEDLAADVDDRPGADLWLAASGLATTVDVDQENWPFIFDDVQYHLQEAETRLEDADYIYRVRQIQSIVQAAENLGRTELRRCSK